MPAPRAVRASRSSAWGSSSITSTVRSSALATAVVSADVTTSAAGGSTRSGSRIVKVEPRPTVLSTVMSPPIIRQKRWLIGRPSPVPP